MGRFGIQCDYYSMWEALSNIGQYGGGEAVDLMPPSSMELRQDQSLLFLREILLMLFGVINRLSDEHEWVKMNFFSRASLKQLPFVSSETGYTQLNYQLSKIFSQIQMHVHSTKKLTAHSLLLLLFSSNSYWIQRRLPILKFLPRHTLWGSENNWQHWFLM